ncbi:Cell-division-associated, ABC-transporter-like signaling protein FtsX [Olavius sp. associated proteobacterium Delta 1]|nr:Cell-division-associated, ABC-transporter-like signaling protein FtsX [Olavius sp. associated proteobacterium Delta 1]
MITLFFKRAIDDIFKNRFLNLVTIITISLSILITSAFILFFINTSEVINSWKKGLRIMAYLKPGVNNTELAYLKQAIQSLDNVQNLRFIPKAEALNQLKIQMEHQASLLENLTENPLPDSIEIRMTANVESWQRIASLATQIETLTQVQEVEYGQRWIGRFIHLFNLFRLAGYAMGALFFMAAIFIVANTIRLVIYSRREEVDIMRLVGATDNFIKIPFYFEGLIQGALGAIIGLGMLYLAFFFISSNVEQEFLPGLFRLKFLPPVILGEILLGSMLVGWLGCYISLKQFLKT